VSFKANAESNFEANREANDDVAQRWRRLQWRCRRGMRELDQLLERYLATWPATRRADARELAQLEQFLDLPDPQLQGYLLAHEVPDDSRWQRLVLEMLALANGSRRAGR
jgi:antitoxin CptB